MIVAQQMDPNRVVLDEMAFVAADTRPSPWTQMASLMGVALALGMVATMVPALTQALGKKEG